MFGRVERQARRSEAKEGLDVFDPTTDADFKAP
jgi:hypothetical protein